MRRALVLVTSLCVTTTALAGPSTTVFPLSAPNLPMKIASAPEELSKALAKELGGTVAPLPIEDAAALSGCDSEATTCLETVSKSVKSKRIVFGGITMIDEKRLKVTLTRFDPGPDRQQRTFTVEGSVDEMAIELVKLSRSLFNGNQGPDEEGPDEEEPDETEPTKKPIEEDPIGGEKIDAPGGQVSASTYVILIGGIAMVGVGGGFLYSANSIANEVNAFKPDRPEDFQRLVPLENKGAQRLVIGGVMTGVGAVAIAYGLFRLLQERNQPARDASISRRFAPVPLRGGAALVFTMEVP